MVNALYSPNIKKYRIENIASSYYYYYSLCPYFFFDFHQIWCVGSTVIGD